jgi:hypothetical protein
LIGLAFQYEALIQLINPVKTGCFMVLIKVFWVLCLCLQGLVFAAEKRVSTSEILQFILSNDLKQSNSWITGLKLTPSFRYEVSGLNTSGDNGEKATTGGDYSLNFGVVYDFRERIDEMSRLEKQKQQIIQEVIKSLGNIQKMKLQAKYLRQTIKALEQRQQIYQTRVRDGLSNQQELWEVESRLQRYQLDWVELESLLSSEKFLVAMRVPERRNELLGLLERWEGFEGKLD